MCEPYNGWKNYQTWAVSLHLSNDEQLFELARATETVDELRTQVRDLIYDALEDAENRGTLVGSLSYFVHDFIDFCLDTTDWNAIFEFVHAD